MLVSGVCPTIVDDESEDKSKDLLLLRLDDVEGSLEVETFLGCACAEILRVEQEGGVASMKSGRRGFRRKGPAHQPALTTEREPKRGCEARLLILGHDTWVYCRMLLFVGYLEGGN